VGESLPDRATKKIAPTIVRDVNDRMRIDQEEIFGPILVVRPSSELTDVIDYINQRPAPLVAYWYGPDNDDFRRFVRHTRSGGVARNDFGAQMIPSAAPFGGVGRAVVSSAAADGLFAGPPVVGFTGRAAFDDRSEHDRLGQLVPGDRACGVVDQFLGIGAGAVDERDDRDDFLPPPLTRPAGDHDVGYCRV
jgi:hypothetical protein